MGDVEDFFRNLYRHFNERNIDPVIASMTEDVKWTNGMEGGYVHGRDEVRAYWTRQFGIVNLMVTPVEIEAQQDMIRIKVHQVVHDLDGNLRGDEMITHIFRLTNNKISAFEIEKQASM